MFKKDILDSPITVFFLCVAISIINILFSVHFISIMFAGILFITFMKMLDKKYYYSLFWVMVAFLFVENIQGFRSFSLITLSLVLYIFVKSNIEHIFTSSDILKSIYVIIFYILMIFLYSFFNSFDIFLVTKIMINLLLDVILVGLFI